MSPLVTFVVLVMCFELIRHLVRAVKRIKALEAEVVDLQKNQNEMLDEMISLSDIVKRNHDLLEGHEKEMLMFRSKFRGTK
jgi:hypothetical protein